MIYRDGKPCPEPIEIEHGIPIPSPKVISPITAAARDMKVGDSIMVPYSRGPVVTMMTKATGFKFTQLRIGSKMRIWRVK